ncbi:MAG: hypothetical protein KGJ06_05165, partial [Pseudomonadota bacterium]|nr:hypothetical protein [Pseudomonadota bacterium]
MLPRLGVGDWGLGIGEGYPLPNAQSLMPDPLWLEIGFGGGEHLAHQAALHPQAGIIGCEPYIDGIAGLLALLSPS